MADAGTGDGAPPAGGARQAASPGPPGVGPDATAPPPSRRRRPWGWIVKISQSVSDAGDQLSQAGADAEKNAQQALDGLGAKLQSLKGQVEKAIEDSGASQDSSAP